jgi:Mg2+-importing ATPase
MGPLSSLFDLLTFAWLGYGMHADATEFRTAWFVESIATQILVIFVIRTASRLNRSRPDRLLVLSSLGALALALCIALTPVGTVVGFVPLTPPVLLGVGVIAVGYLAAAEALKTFALGPGARHGTTKSGHPARRARGLAAGARP